MSIRHNSAFELWYNASVTDTQPPTDNPPIKRDSRGRFLERPANSAPVITRDNVSIMLAKREAKKHVLIEQAANMVANKALKESRYKDVRELVGSAKAYLSALAIGRMGAAIDPDSPYGNAAAQWVMEHTGNAEPREVNVNVDIDASSAERRILELYARAQARARDAGEVIDGQATDIDSQTDSADSEGADT